MNILHITTDYLPIRGGAELCLDYLIKVLNTRGHNQKVIQIDTGIKAPNVKGLTRFPGPLGKKRGVAVWYYQLSLLAAYNEIRKADALIVHYSFYYPPVFYHPKTVILDHCIEWKQPPTKLTHKIREKIAHLAFRQNKYHVTTDTNFLREMGVQVEPATRMFEEVAPGKWFIPNCADLSRFKDVKPVETFKDREYIIIARNASRHKGIHLALEAFGRFHKEHPETLLLIAGSFPDKDYYNELLAIIRKMDITEYVLFAGSIYWEKMPSYFKTAQMALVPTIYCEGTSLSTLESMAAGTCTITTPHGGLNDLPGVKCKPDAYDLARVMLECYPNRKEIGKNQQKIIETTFNMDNWSKAWINVIDNL